MADVVETKPSDSAEKAYAAAAELAVKQADAAKVVPAAELQFPAKAKRVEAPVAAPIPAVQAKAPAKPAKPVVAAKKPAPKIKPAITSKPEFKEPVMTAKKTTDYTAKIKSAAADVQAKAKLALAKGNEVLAEAGTFTKGNVEAIKSSGQILGTGLQELGKTYVAEGKTAYATVTGDFKQLKAVKTPTDLVRLQTSILRRNLDSAFAFGGKNSESLIKLASETFAPISARASLAIEKVKKAA